MLSQQTWQPQPLRTFNKCEICRVVSADQVQLKVPQKLQILLILRPHLSRWSKTGFTVLTLLCKKMLMRKVVTSNQQKFNRVIVRSNQVWSVPPALKDPWLISNSNSNNSIHTLRPTPLSTITITMDSKSSTNWLTKPRLTVKNYYSCRITASRIIIVIRIATTSFLSSKSHLTLNLSKSLMTLEA